MSAEHFVSRPVPHCFHISPLELGKTMTERRHSDMGRRLVEGSSRVISL